MKLAVIEFPGSNCDRDMLNAAMNTGITAVYVDYRETSLYAYDGVLIPGGFSFGDYLRCGAMARVAPVVSEVKRFAAEGKPVLGVCNGFQILTEIGLLPGALLHNESHQFICKDEQLTIRNHTKFTQLYDDNEQVIFPIAHGQGSYYCSDNTLSELQQNQQIVLTYTDNPNGSVDDIAGIISREGNVLGMMPHPERAMETLLGSDDGKRLFQSILESWGR